MVVDTLCYILIIAAIVISVATIANGIEDYSKKESNKTKKENISFKESIDLVGLPIITFTNNRRKLHFLLDTGSDMSYINKSVLPHLKYKDVDKEINIVNSSGSALSQGCCELSFKYKKQEFIEEFYKNDLDEAFRTIKEDSGVQLHGILGSRFFTKYKYILDFDNLIAYNNMV